MNSYRIYYKDGHQESIGARHNSKGLLDVSNSYYSADGYYHAGKSITIPDFTPYELEEQLSQIELMPSVERVARF